MVVLSRGARVFELKKSPIAYDASQDAGEKQATAF